MNVRLGVAAVALVHWLYAAMYAAGAAFYGQRATHPESIEPATGWSMAVVFGTFGAVNAIVGFGLWRVQRWARATSIVLSLLTLPTALFMVEMAGFWRLLTIPISLAIVLYLLTSRVRHYFVVRSDEEDHEEILAEQDRDPSDLVA